MDDIDFQEDDILDGWNPVYGQSGSVNKNKRSYRYPWLDEYYVIGDWKNSVRNYKCKGCNKDMKTSHPAVPLSHLLKCSQSSSELKHKINLELTQAVPEKRRGESKESFSLRKTKVEKTEYFLKKLTNMIVVANLPLSSVEMKEVKEFFEKFLPEYELPTRSHLSKVLIPKEVSEIDLQMRIKFDRAEAHSIGIEFDSWNDMNGESCFAFIANLRGGERFLLQVSRESEFRHTGAFIRDLLKVILKRVGITKINCIISDGDSACTRGRELIV